MNQAEFFQQHAVDGNLPDHLMTQMLALPEGEITFVDQAQGEGSASPAAAGQEGATGAPAPAPTPDPAAAPAATPAAPAEPTQQVVLAKDGVHTIPFERLEEARLTARQEKERADAAAAEAARLAAEVERLKTASAAPSPAPAPSTTAAAPAPAAEGEGGLFGDYSDKALAAGIEKLVEQRTAALRTELDAVKTQLTPFQEQAQISATEQHWKTIYTAHPDADSLPESTELQGFIAKQPSFLRAAYEKVLDEGSAAEVVELYDAFKAATGRTQPPAPSTGAPAAPSSAAQAAAAAAAAIAGAKQPPPTSLSEIPAGNAAHHDEAQAMLEMSPNAVMQKFDGKTPEQIRALLDKVL